MRTPDPPSLKSLDHSMGPGAARRSWGVRPTIVALSGLLLGRRRGGPGVGSAREDRRAAPLGVGAPEGVPAPGALHRPQTGHRLGPRATPAHPRPFLPRRDQRLVRTLDHAGANRELASH